jgi:hypothetical protein
MSDDIDKLVARLSVSCGRASCAPNRDMPPLTPEAANWYLIILLVLFFLHNIGIHEEWWPFVGGAMQGLAFVMLAEVLAR